MSLVLLGENHGSWEETGNAPMKILRYMGNGMYERCDSELGRPYLSPKGKEEPYKQLEISELGTSQGSVISPLLANIYLNTLDRLWEKYGLTHGILVRYADDTVIICKNKKRARHAHELLQYIMGKLDLKLHPVKTKIINMWDGTEGFDFWGLHYRRFSKINKKGYRYGETYQYPSKKAMKKMKQTVKDNINQRYLLVKTEEELIKILNPKIVGWRNYYRTRNDRKWMNAIDWYILCTFVRWNNKKHQQKRKLKGLYETKLRLRDKGLQLMTA